MFLERTNSIRDWYESALFKRGSSPAFYIGQKGSHLWDKACGGLGGQTGNRPDPELRKRKTQRLLQTQTCFVLLRSQPHTFLRAWRNPVKPQLLTPWANSHSAHQSERGLSACQPCLSLTEQSVDLFPAQSGLQVRAEQGCVGVGRGRIWIDVDSVQFKLRGSLFWPGLQGWACALLALLWDTVLSKSDNNTVKTKFQPFHVKHFPVLSRALVLAVVPFTVAWALFLLA